MQAQTYNNKFLNILATLIGEYSLWLTSLLLVLIISDWKDSFYDLLPTVLIIATFNSVYDIIRYLKTGEPGSIFYLSSMLPKINKTIFILSLLLLTIFLLFVVL